MLTITAYIEQTEPWSLGKRGVAQCWVQTRTKQYYLEGYERGAHYA